MPRVTHVKKAQPRYKTVPVLGDDGHPVRTPVISKRTGEQKTTKTGRLVFMTQTVSDKTQPLPPLECDFNGCTIDKGQILPGTSYKHITPKSGPYGGRQRSRHAQHPTWNVWEYSSSLSARVAQVQADMESAIEALDSVDDFESVRDDLTQMAQDLLDEKEEALGNMPEGLADGSQTEEQRDALQSWVDEIEGAEEPDVPEAEVEAFYVINTDGTGDAIENPFETEVEAEQAMEDLEGEDGEFEVEGRTETPEDGELSEEQLDKWLDEARTALSEACSAFEG